MIISILNEKGGVGKTTMAVNLACALKERGHNILLVDSDEQGSAKNWHVRNGGERLPLVILDVITIDKDIQVYLPHYDFIIVDGAPQLTIMAAKTVKCSDVVLIPVTPSQLDVDASAHIVGLIKERQSFIDEKPKAAFLINRQIGNTRIGREIRTVLTDFELPIFTQGTTNRVAYAESVSQGHSVLDGKDVTAINEMRTIATELLEFIQ
jgi:chromosome partitioning protein